jgi:thiopeptide-type bacteriocin biosynthesis protein
MQINLELAWPSLPLRWRAHAPADWMHERILHMSEGINRRLLRAVAPLKRAGLVERCFFQRKPPGLRWRFSAHDAATVWQALAPSLERLQERGLVRHARRVIYEPETFLLGGTAALQAVHEYADADAAAWSELVVLRRRGALPWAFTLLSYAHCNELFFSTLAGCPEEVWDTWCRLAHFHGIAPPHVAGSRIRPSPGSLPGASDLTVPALRALREANVTLAARLNALQYDGKLLQGLRNVLAMVALLHWNRLGVTPEQRHRMLNAALSAWHPYDYAGRHASAQVNSRLVLPAHGRA